jgi:hypothetical protein
MLSHVQTVAPGSWPRSVPVVPHLSRPGPHRLDPLRVRFLVGVFTVEKHELSKLEFEIIALKALLQSNLDQVTADKVTDLHNMFQDTYTGWLPNNGGLSSRCNAKSCL